MARRSAVGTRLDFIENLGTRLDFILTTKTSKILPHGNYPRYGILHCIYTMLHVYCGGLLELSPARDGKAQRRRFAHAHKCIALFLRISTKAQSLILVKIIVCTTSEYYILTLAKFNTSEA